jgi:hypothetical protein
MMITNPEIAKLVDDRIREIKAKLDETLNEVKTKCAASEYEAYKAAVGKVIALLLFDILEPLYEQNPQLKPPRWDD